MSTAIWTEHHHDTRQVDDRAADLLALCELVQRALWGEEVGAVDLEHLPPVPPSLAPANDGEGWDNACALVAAMSA